MGAFPGKPREAVWNVELVLKIAQKATNWFIHKV